MKEAKTIQSFVEHYLNSKPSRSQLLEFYKEALNQLVAIDEYLEVQCHEDAFYLGVNYTEQSMLENISIMAESVQSGFAPGQCSLAIGAENLVVDDKY